MEELLRPQICIIPTESRSIHQVQFKITVSGTNYLTDKILLGNLYIADSYNSRIRKVTVSTGIITTIAGTGTSSYSGDSGQATSASLYIPVGVGLDSSGTNSKPFFKQSSDLLNMLLYSR